MTWKVSIKEIFTDAARLPVTSEVPCDSAESALEYLGKLSDAAKAQGVTYDVEVIGPSGETVLKALFSAPRS